MCSSLKASQESLTSETNSPGHLSEAPRRAHPRNRSCNSSSFFLTKKQGTLIWFSDFRRAWRAKPMPTAMAAASRADRSGAGPGTGARDCTWSQRRGGRGRGRGLNPEPGSGLGPGPTPRARPGPGAKSTVNLGKHKRLYVDLVTQKHMS